MALNKTMTFDLELKPGGIPPIIHASQGDIGRMFKANIYWDGSAATSYISGATVNLRGRKPDKTVFDYSATLAGSMVTFETTEQMTIIPGPVECELVFSNDGDVIASANFVLIVEESPYDPNALSESDIEGLTDVLEGFQRLNRDSNGVVKIGDGVTASGTAEPIKGFYVHDEATDTDGVAKIAPEAIDGEIVDEGARGQIDRIVENNKTTDDLKNKYFEYNLFDGNYVTPLSVLTDGSFGGNEGTITAVVKVKPNSTYYINRYDTGYSRYRIACTENFPTVGTQGRLVYNYQVQGGDALQKVITGNAENYIAVFVSLSGETPNLSVTNYVPLNFPEYGKIDNTLLVTIDKTKELKLAVSDFAKFNLFDSAYTGLSLTYYGEDVGVETPYMKISEAKPNFRTVVTKIKGGHTYYVKTFGNISRFRVATFKDYTDQNETSTNFFMGESKNIIFTTKCEITARKDDNYLLVYVSNTSQEPNINIVDGMEIDEYLPADDFIAIKEKDTPNFFFLSDFTGVFSSPDTIQGGSTSDTVNLVNSSPSIITDIYDALVTEMPGYVSKTTLATVGEYTIAQYDFKNMRIENNTSKPINKPKIIVTAGVHGYEQGSCWCLAQFMDLLARNTTDELLTAIKENIDFSIVPVANPYGFAHNQRKNENGIDINRNFKYGFTPGNDPTSDYYGGTTAESEVETQAIVQFLENNSDAILVLDYHNIASGYPLYYLYSDEQTTLCNAVFSALTDKWRGIYTGFPTNRLLGYCNNGTPASFAYYATYEQYNSFTLETPWTMPVVGQAQYDKPTIMTGIDVFANTVLAIAKHLK